MSVYRHILVPTDFSTFSESAALRARALAKAFSARLSLLHVVDYVPPAYVAVELPEQYGSEEWLMEKARRQLEEWAGTVELSAVSKWVRIGVPKSTVIDVAEEEDVDLIVIGTSSPDILKRFVGSTTTGVLQHAPCDVLSVQTMSTATRN